MEKLIPYEKLSKKEKRKMDLAKRQTWGELNPRHQKAHKQQGLQQKEDTGLEEGTSRSCVLCCCVAQYCVI